MEGAYEGVGMGRMVNMKESAYEGRHATKVYAK